MISTKLAVQCVLDAFEYPVICVRDGGSTVSLIGPQGPVISNIPIKVGGDSYMPAWVVKFFCRQCGEEGTYAQHCQCGKGWVTKSLSLLPDAYLGWVMEQPYNNGTLAQAIASVARTGKNRTAARASEEARDFLMREIADALDQIQQPTGDGLKILPDPGRTRVIFDTAPWLDNPKANLHIAEVDVETRVHVGQYLQGKGLSMAGTSNSKPAKVLFKAGAHGVPEIIEQVYPGWRYTKPSRFSSMITAATQAVELDEWEDPIVQTGAATHGRNLLTVWMAHQRNRNDLILMTPSALTKFWFDHHERLAIPAGSVIMVKDGETFVEDTKDLAVTPQGYTYRYKAMEFSPNIQHRVQIIGTTKIVEGTVFCEEQVTVDVVTKRVAGEGSKVTCNGNKGSVAIWRDGGELEYDETLEPYATEDVEEDGKLVIFFDGCEFDVEVLAPPDRIVSGATGGAYYEALASQVAAMGEGTLAVSYELTFEQLKEKLPSQEKPGFCPVYLKRGDKLAFLGNQLIGWMRWSLQPQHPEVQSAVSSSAARTSTAILRKDNSSVGAKVLGWELTEILRLAPRVGMWLKGFQDEKIRILIDEIRSCLLLKPCRHEKMSPDMVDILLMKENEDG